MTKKNNSNYKKAGYGAGNIGMGENPALLIVDFQKAFTDPDSPMGGSESIKKAVIRTSEILPKIRKLNIPIIHTLVAYRYDKKDMGLWEKKVSKLSEVIIGTKWAELDDKVINEKDEIVITKKMPSAFFNTNLINILINKRIDTLLIGGCTTSGCVRATVIDSFSFGFKPIVLEDCVGDQGIEPHEANLFDINNRYGDIILSKNIVSHLEELYV